MTAPPSQLVDALRVRYVLERELGRGGMAAVYLAHDLRHDRPVALKVLHPELAATLGPERFLREIKTAARLQHPHILSVHDSGEAAGQLWFTMPYVEGESLRDRLRREKQLSVDEAVRITREAAQALDYAHRHGVVHRDVKPENLLLTEDGNTLVADFGVARALQGGEDALTQTGLAVGTPAYMSPEQASGARDLDARTDVYALGTVLYEMLAGEPPFAGPTPQAAVARRFTETPRPLRQLRETAPEAVEHAVMKALAKAPADRFPSAAEFARALAIPAVTAPGVTAEIGARTVRPAPRRLPLAALTLGLGLLVGLGVLFAWRRTQGVAEAGAGPERLAVLPFENLGDSADAYFAEGVSDEVRGKLAGLPTLEVIARTSSSQYHGSRKPPAQVGRELGVRYLLTGTVRWDKRAGGAGRVRVSPELIEARTGATRWQQPFEAPLTDLFQVQADIASRVAEALDVALGGSERRTIADRPTADLQAYDMYLRAQAAWLGGADRDPQSLRRAAGLYRQAVTLDSGFAAAWAGLAYAHSLLFSAVSPSPQDSAAAREAAERAMALAPDRPDVRVGVSYYYSTVREDEPRSLEILLEGLSRAPNDPSLLSGAAGSMLELGRVEEALAYARRARALDPRSPATLRGLTVLLSQARQCPAAVATADSLFAGTPLPGPLRFLVAAHLTCSGDLQLARQVIRSAYSRVDRDAFLPILATYGDLYWVAEEADRRRMEELPPVAFPNRADWALVQTELRWLRGDFAGMRAYADTARMEFDKLLRAAPDESETIALRGLALAYRGRHAEAASDIGRARVLQPVDRGLEGAYLVELQARTHVLAGRHDEAVDALELILREPYYITPVWLRVDPAYAPLRGNPRFERLVKGTT